jgi:hypothetical protein
MEFVIDLLEFAHVILDISALIVLNNILCAQIIVQTTVFAIELRAFVLVMTAISEMTVLYNIWCVLMTALEMVFATV